MRKRGRSNDIYIEREKECVDNEQAMLIQAVNAFILFGIGRTIYNII